MYKGFCYNCNCRLIKLTKFQSLSINLIAIVDGESINAAYVDLTNDLDFDFTLDFTNDVIFTMDETVELTNDPNNSTHLDGFEWNFVGFQNKICGTNDINQNKTVTEVPSNKSLLTLQLAMPTTMSDLSEADVMAMKFE